MKRPAEGIPAVGYIRMSTDDQKDSPDRQRHEIEVMAARDGYSIVRWYEDHGISGTASKNRPAFQQLMTDVEKRRDFKAVLMYELSRFSREDVFDATAHWKLLKDAGITLVTVLKGEVKFDDIAGLITAILGQHEARSESVRLAQRVLSGKKKKATEGVHGSSIPFGFEREIYDESGKLIKRVAHDQRFKRPKSWTSKLVPSCNPEVVDAVRYVFESIKAGVPMRQISMELNRRGMRTGHLRKDGSKGVFRPTTIRRIATNPVYTGLLRFGHIQRGKFEQEKYDLILVPNAHDAIISPALFNQVNGILDAAYRAPGGRAAPGKYPLSKLIVCGHCGRGMTGRDQKFAERGTSCRQYFCHDNQTGVDKCDVSPSIFADALEGLVLRAVATHILCEANRERLAEAIQRLVRSNSEPSPEEGQLQALRMQIERAEENLALATDPENFRAISALLAKWRAQERKLEERVRIHCERRGTGPIRLKSADDLKLLRDNLHLADRVLLAAALRKLVQRIEVKREDLSPEYPGDVSLSQCYGMIEFFPELFGEDPNNPTPWIIPFGDPELYPERRYIDVAKHVNTIKRPMRAAELGVALNMAPTLALYHAKRAVKVGLISSDRDGQTYVFQPLNS